MGDTNYRAAGGKPVDVTKLLERLRKVKPNGAGKWLACCPAHEDRSPSLAIRVTDDGRLLVHCFAGCGAADVIAAVDLEFSDLFPERRGETMRPVNQPFTPGDALRCLASESGVIAIAVADIAECREFLPADAERVALASERIQTAMEYVYGQR